MFIYLIVFALSLLLIYYSEKFNPKNRIHILLVFIAIVMPALLAGLRSDSIGTDTMSYLVPIFKNALTADSFVQFQSNQFLYNWSYATISEYEIGFTSLVYIIAKLSGNLYVLQTIIAGFIIWAVYTAINKWKREIPVWFGMAVFYFMYFNVTMNMMRQWIAMSILLLGTRYIFERKKKYFLYVLAACLFHASAVMGVGFYVLYHFINDHIEHREKRRKKQYVLRVHRWKIRLTNLGVLLAFLVAAIAIFFADTVLTPILSFLGLSRYQFYLSGTLNFMLNQVIIRIPILILLVLGGKILKQKIEGANFFETMILLDLVLSQLSGLTSYSSRIALYFQMFMVFSIPALCGCTRVISQKLMKSMMMVYLLVYWLYYFAVMNSHATVPYIPFWLA